MTALATMFILVPLALAYFWIIDMNPNVEENNSPVGEMPGMDWKKLNNTLKHGEVNNKNKISVRQEFGDNKHKPVENDLHVNKFRFLDNGQALIVYEIINEYGIVKETNSRFLPKSCNPFNRKDLKEIFKYDKPVANVTFNHKYETICELDSFLSTFFKDTSDIPQIIWGEVKAMENMLDDLENINMHTLEDVGKDTLSLDGTKVTINWNNLRRIYQNLFKCKERIEEFMNGGFEPAPPEDDKELIIVNGKDVPAQQEVVF